MLQQSGNITFGNQNDFKIPGILESFRAEQQAKQMHDFLQSFNFRMGSTVSQLGDAAKEAEQRADNRVLISAAGISRGSPLTSTLSRMGIDQGSTLNHAQVDIDQLRDATGKF